MYVVTVALRQYNLSQMPLGALSALSPRHGVLRLHPASLACLHVSSDQHLPGAHGMCASGPGAWLDGWCLLLNHFDGKA